MEQLNKANQDNKMLKKACKKKAQQSHVLVSKATQQNQASATKAKAPTKDSGAKPTMIEKKFI